MNWVDCSSRVVKHKIEIQLEVFTIFFHPEIESYCLIVMLEGMCVAARVI